MKPRLMELRKAAGYKSRDEFAELIGVNKFTYKTWETGTTVMNVEQAYTVATFLGCTVDELYGVPSVKSQDDMQTELNEIYEQLTDEEKKALLSVAKVIKKD